MALIKIKWSWSKKKGEEGNTPGFLRTNWGGESKGSAAKNKGRDQKGWLQNLENWSQNQWDNVTGKNAREAQKKAMAAAENERRESLVKEFGARQQADSLAYAASMNGMGGGSGNSNAPGLVGMGGAPGTIGSNITSSGTF